MRKHVPYYNIDLIEPPRRHKPHIVKRNGYWRVSTFTRENVRKCLGARWSKAYEFTISRNRQLMRIENGTA